MENFGMFFLGMVFGVIVGICIGVLIVLKEHKFNTDWWKEISKK